LAILCAPFALGGEVCAAGRCSSEEEVALVQLRSQVHGRSSKLQHEASAGADIMHVGRSFLSTEPEKSAAFFLKYFKAKRLETPVCMGAEQAAVQVETGPGKTAMLSFVRDNTLPVLKGDMTPAQLVNLMKAAMDDIFSGNEDGKYISWINSRDSFNNTYFDINRMKADGVDIGIFHWPGTPPGLGIVKFLVPHTLLNFEVQLSQEELLKHDLPSYMVEDCREDGAPRAKSVFTGEQPWFKTTLSSADPEAAANWAIAVLGAEAFPAPYPWPPVEGCTAAKWVLFPEQQYMLNFVLSADDLKGEKGSAQEFRDKMESFRQETGGAFDQYMLNSLILKVADLEPYVQRLRARGEVFLIHRVDDGFALFVEIPRNSMTVQLRSDVFSGTAPVGEELCSVSPLGGITR